MGGRGILDAAAKSGENGGAFIDWREMRPDMFVVIVLKLLSFDKSRSWSRLTCNLKRQVRLWEAQY